MNKQVKISSQLSMNFFHQVTWGRSRTRKKLIKGKVPPNNKSLDDQLKSLVNGPHKE